MGNFIGLIFNIRNKDTMTTSTNYMTLLKHVTHLQIVFYSSCKHIDSMESLPMSPLLICKSCIHFRASNIPRASASKTDISPAYIQLFAWIDSLLWLCITNHIVNEEFPVKINAFTFNFSLPVAGDDHHTVSVLVLCRQAPLLPQVFPLTYLLEPYFIASQSLVLLSFVPKFANLLPIIYPTEQWKKLLFKFKYSILNYEMNSNYWYILKLKMNLNVKIEIYTRMYNLKIKSTVFK